MNIVRRNAANSAAGFPGPGRVVNRRVALHTLGACASLALLSAAPTQAHESEGHSHHAPGGTTRRSVVDYAIPDVRLVRQDGRMVKLDEEINDGRPTVLAFIYTSCTTVCPVLSQVLAVLQAKLGPTRDQVHLMSISIDPEFDTPARLRAYAKQFDAGAEWDHYTGTLAASQLTQRAFDVYRGDKMSHTPAVLIRPLPAARWVRIDGFPSADELLAELPSYCVSARSG